MAENEKNKKISSYIKGLVDPKVEGVEEGTTLSYPVKSSKEKDSQTINYNLDVDHRGTRLFIRGWLPKKESNKPPLIIVHDFAEDSNLYKNFSQLFSEKGYPVYVFDLRGHGRNGSYSAATSSMDSYINDLLQVSNWIRFKSNRRRPVVLSQGLSSLFVSLFAEKYPSYISGVALFSPIMILDKEPSLWWKATINTLRELIPDRIISRRFLPDFLKAFDRDSENFRSFYFTPQLVYDFLQELEKSSCNFAKLQIDTVMFFGGKKNQISYDEICRKVNTHEHKSLINIFSMDESITHPLSSDFEKVDSILTNLIPWLEKKEESVE